MGAPTATLVYAVVTVALFRELVPNITTHLYAYLGDPLLNAAILAWNATEIPLTDRWWNFPSFAPLTGVTAFTEHLLLAYPIASPIFWLTGNAILAFNVVFLLSFPLNGLAAYALAREVTGSRPAAFVGGLAYAFAPYQAVQMTHLQMLMGFGIPLTLLGLHRYINAVRLKPDATPEGVGPKPDTTPEGVGLKPDTTTIRRRRTGLAIFGFGWLASALATAYMIVFVPVLVVLWCLWFVRPAEWKRLVPPLALAVLVVVAMTPLLLGYQSRQDAYGLERGYDEIRSFAADITGVGRIFQRSTLWKGVLPDTYEEGAIFPGFMIVALGVCALVLRRAVIAFYAVAALVMWSLTLGPEPEWNGNPIAYGPYRLLMELPGLDSIRVPARAWLPAALCLAVLAAFGVKALVERVPRHARAIAFAVGLAIVAEGWFYEVIVAAPRMTIERAIPEGAVVLDLPIDEAFWNAIPQYRAVIGRYRAISGYSGYEPPHFNPLRHAIADLVPGTLEPYRRAADVWVIIRPGQTPRVVEWIVGQPGAEKMFEQNGTLLYRLPRL